MHMSSVRFCLKPENSNCHGFQPYGPSSKGTKLLLKVIKAIIIIKGSIADMPSKKKKKSSFVGMPFQKKSKTSKLYVRVSGST